MLNDRYLKPGEPARTVGAGTHTRMFWDEYRPIIIDFFLAFPLVLMFRRWRIGVLNRSIAMKETQTTLLSLPDELILEICRHVKISGCPTTTQRALACSRGLLHAPKTISGPMPVGSP